MIKVGICGHYGKGHILLNGQTVKTKELTKQLIRIFGSNNVMTIDTHNWVKNPLKLIINCYALIKNCENIIILPAHNGVKIFVPLFLALNRFFDRKIHYVVIGGWLPKLLDKNRKLAMMISKLDGVYVETFSMMQRLERIGLDNTRLLVNFKQLNILNKNELVNNHEEPYKLCTFSRVMKEKGIEDAINIVCEINNIAGRTVYTLDIFGQIDPDYKERFEELRRNLPRYIQYKGVVDYSKSVEVLKDYFILLFPTHFFTEGIPGTIIDAYAAGVPVIASNWESASEVIDNNETGFIYDFNNIEQLKKILVNVMTYPEVVAKMKTKCINKAEGFLPEKAIEDFVEFL